MMHDGKEVIISQNEMWMTECQWLARHEQDHRKRFFCCNPPHSQNLTTRHEKLKATDRIFIDMKKPAANGRMIDLLQPHILAMKWRGFDGCLFPVRKVDASQRLQADPDWTFGMEDQSLELATRIRLAMHSVCKSFGTRLSEVGTTSSCALV
ncbi:hypothetical protein VTP01DRAFT_2232 [Rhizomucor pusillus]|uniref:uncharacterized protein n=1 Tax=Rhizomucor pusillus TaxID=4840 RepID=UPI003742A6DC